MLDPSVALYNLWSYAVSGLAGAAGLLLFQRCGSDPLQLY